MNWTTVYALLKNMIGATKEELEQEITEKIGLTNQFLDELPEVGESGVLYFIPKDDVDPSAEDQYFMYVWDPDNTEFVLLDPDMDMSPYAKTADLATVATSGAYSDLSGTPDLTPYITEEEADEKYMSGDVLDDETVTGNPVTFESLDGGYAKSCEVEFGPIQSGSGDPSPSNPRPISGRNSVVLGQGGKNLVNWNVGKFSGGTGLVVTLIKGTYTLSQSVDVNTGNWYIKAQKSDSTYCSKDELGLSSWASSSTTGVYYGSNNAHSITFTIPENGVEIQVGTQTNPATDTPAQLEVGSVKTDYVPYVSYSTKTATFPSTIYGGSHEFVSGKAKSEWGYIASYNGETITEPWISDRDVYVEGTTPSIGAEVCYKLATPTEITLTPETIELLKGNNVLFTDGDNIELTAAQLELVKVVANPSGQATGTLSKIQINNDILGIPTELPAVTSSDEGKVLMVNDQGEWVADDIPDGTNTQY